MDAFKLLKCNKKLNHGKMIASGFQDNISVSPYHLFCSRHQLFTWMQPKPTQRWSILLRLQMGMLPKPKSCPLP